MTQTYTKKDRAVSPVVGVMLMLVVTIIIAAVVSAFAGGLGSSQVKTPQASIQITTSYTTYPEINFIHQGGDPIPTKDLQIITWLTLPNGTIVQNKWSPSSPPVYTTTSSGMRYAKYPYVYDFQKFPQGTDKTSATYYYQTAAQIGAASFVAPPNWFGQYTFSNGMTMRTYTGTGAILGLVNSSQVYPDSAVTSTDNVRKNALLIQCFQQNCPVEIKWLYVPSGKYILDQKITLQG